jgi:integrase
MKRRPFIHRPAFPLTPAFRPVDDWLPVNQGFYANFRNWLHQSGYGPSALNIYGLAARLLFSLHSKPYWQLDPDADVQQVRDYVTAHYPSVGTRASYFKGLAKFEQYLRRRCHKPASERPINWEYYFRSLPPWMVAAVRIYLTHCRRSWPVERQRDLTAAWLSHLTTPLRGLQPLVQMTNIGDLTPAAWFAYVDQRLAAGISPVTLNDEFWRLCGWLHFLEEQGQPVCRRMLKVKPLNTGPRLPKDVPVEQLRRLQQAIQTAAAEEHAGLRRMGIMDLAWFLLMLHSGLRTGEVRRLKLSDLDWGNRRVRIDQSKGLKDRLVPLSAPAIQALKAYLGVRGPAETLPEQVFIYRHIPLTLSYCWQRLLKYYPQHCGVRLTPHQLRHSCATLLLNAGAPVLTVKTILGHKHIDTTLGYARLYDGTLAADYYAAMAQIEGRLALPEDARAAPPRHGELLALVDSLRSSTLNKAQATTVRRLRVGIMALAERDAISQQVTKT